MYKKRKQWSINFIDMQGHKCDLHVQYCKEKTLYTKDYIQVKVN